MSTKTKRRVPRKAAALASAYTEDSFDEMLPTLRVHFTNTLEAHGPALFKVQTDQDLWALYLDNLPNERQHHVCHCCKSFIQNYGNLAAVDDDGNLVPAMWTEETTDFFKASFAAMSKAVRRGKITGVALFKTPIWGTTDSGGWTHFAVTPPKQLLHTHLVLTPGQAAAAKKEDYRTLVHGLSDFDQKLVAQAATLLQADTLYRGEKIAGPVKFLLALHEVRAQAKGRNRDNLTWKAVATAPVGFCQPRSTMIGTLLEDIKEGYSFEEVKRRFGSKMNPLQYQRPQAAPRVGNIEQAEKLIAEMGLESSLRRRFARLDDLQALWLPKAAEQPKQTGGIFGHLKAYGQTTAEPLTMSAQPITWEKFARTVLPTAIKMQVYTEAYMNFCGMVTAVDPEAPQILQWDNPVSWYVYSGKSQPRQWSLPAHEWVDVTAVTLQPSMWTDPERYAHQGKSVIFVLDGARDLETKRAGLGLFPEILKSELHSIRATIEAYSRSKEIEGGDEASANGIKIGLKETGGKIRVTTSLGTAVYTIDRWD